MKISPFANAILKGAKPPVKAEESTRDLQRCVCEMKQLSFVGCERRAGETVVGGFSTVGRVKCWGGL